LSTQVKQPKQNQKPKGEKTAMQARNLDHIENNSAEHTKKSNMFIAATFATMLILVAIGLIFG
jgi:hypothetical protein